MNISLILKKMKMSARKNGVGSVLKLFFGQIGWAVAGPLCRRSCEKKPVAKKQFVFVSKPDYSDNAYYLFRYLSENRTGSEYSFIWLVDDRSKYHDGDGRTHFCSMYSPWHAGLSKEALKAVLTSEYVFFTHASPLHKLQKRADQTVVNLWHGCGYKNIRSTAHFERDNPFDYALVPGKVFIETKSAFWACEKEKILTIGYPRYDEFFRVSDATVKMVSDIRGGAEKLIVWMPTYRKTEISQFAVSKLKSAFELPILQSKDDLVRLDRKCSESGVRICVKRHHYQLRYESEDLDLQNIVFIDDGDFIKAGASLYGLLACTDGLITDYSSVAIDYLLLDKPMAFTLDDFDEYGDVQGFVFDDPLKYMPGAHLYRYDDLAGFIDAAARGEDGHREERLSIMDEVHDPCGDYCGRICGRFGL